MKYLIKIKRDTIRPNPNAGNRDYAVPGRSFLTAERYQVVRGFLCYQHLVLRSADITYVKDSDTPWQVRNVKEGQIVNQVTLVGFEPCKEWPSEVPILSEKLYRRLRYGALYEVWTTFEMSRPVEHCRTLIPAASHLFEREAIQVQCEECGAEFSYRDLKADAMGYGDDEIWSNAICPECGHWDCCELEYEKLEDVLEKA
jgi:hypothetical protein